MAEIVRGRSAAPWDQRISPQLVGQATSPRNASRKALSRCLARCVALRLHARYWDLPSETPRTMARACRPHQLGYRQTHCAARLAVTPANEALFWLQNSSAQDVYMERNQFIELLLNTRHELGLHYTRNYYYCCYYY